MLPLASLEFDIVRGWGPNFAYTLVWDQQMRFRGRKKWSLVQKPFLAVVALLVHFDRPNGNMFLNSSFKQIHLFVSDTKETEKEKENSHDMFLCSVKTLRFK